MTVGMRIRALREDAGLSRVAFAEKLGMPHTTLRNYENDSREPGHSVLIKIAEAFNVTVDYLLGIEKDHNLYSIPNIIPLPTTYTVPLVGDIACGQPILAVEEAEEAEEVVEVPEGIKADFALRCKGDSMINARIFDGDIVYIKQQSTVSNGEIAAVCIMDAEEEATLKRVQLFDDHISLEPANPMYEPWSYWREEMNRVRILGKAVAFTSYIR